MQEPIANPILQLDGALRARLQALGARKNRSPDWLVHTAIEEYILREETYEREKQEDTERWQRYQATGYAIPNEDVDAWLLRYRQRPGMELPPPEPIDCNRFRQRG